MFSRLSFTALVLGLAACANGSSGTPVCPCAVGTPPTIRYTGSFVPGGAELAPPILFTATNETVTVTVTQGSVPVSNLSVGFVGPCSAAALGAPAPNGTFTVSSVASGSCTINVSSSTGGTTVHLSVP
jgi:hypothetical protein